MTVLHFLFDSVREMLRGPREYWMWLGGLAAIFAFGVWNYSQQFMNGLVVTGMSDQVSWGFYISNFAFLVGIAAAAVLLVIPAYIFDRKDIKEVVLLETKSSGDYAAGELLAQVPVVANIAIVESPCRLNSVFGVYELPL